MFTFLAGLSAVTGGCGAGSADVQDEAALTDEEPDDGWRLLFDGSTTDGWRAYNGDDVPDSWHAEDGLLVFDGSGGGDIITTDEFENFELALDWRIEPGGNSGIFYRAAATDDPIYFSAPEYQLLDDAGHADGQAEITSAGSNFAVHPVPRGVVRPAGEWNSSRIVADGNHIEHWLNGERVVEYELHSDDWNERVANSKFSAWPDYGQSARGHIGLQDHGNRVEFRNIRIRVLP